MPYNASYGALVDKLLTWNMVMLFEKFLRVELS